jgi:drug/metabolite transporter (DMT)-like permease
MAMLAFAGNSLLCREALLHTRIDPANFTLVRIAAGALALGLLVWIRDGRAGFVASLSGGSWRSALALFVYAAAFSFAYQTLTVATGALLLFGAVQATMIGYGLFKGERFGAMQVVGIVLACGGLVYLLLPGVDAPAPSGALLMIAAGVAWGAYSLRGRVGGDPTRATAGNFIRAVPFALLASALALLKSSLDARGVAYAVASGALTSGVGYAIWYTAVRDLNATSAAMVQLSVPVITAFAGVVLLGESVTARLVLASIAVLGGIALVIARTGERRA